MRGLLPMTVMCSAISGITPAHAGLTFVVACVAFWLRDHPRACGAYAILLIVSIILWGSPPRMRGLPVLLPVLQEHAGITPAHAGLTPCRKSKNLRSRDHPRACGAYMVNAIISQPNSGSPPRMRGLLKIDKMTQTQRRITPAHAGLTSTDAVWIFIGRDHPRACGAYLQLKLLIKICLGSPPRMRGLLIDNAACKSDAGITPAHAGLTVTE